MTLRKKLDLSQEEMAHLMGVSMRTVARWETGGVEPEPLLQRKLCGLKLVVEALKNVGEAKDIVEWLETPEPRFHEQPPMDLLASAYGTKELLAHVASWGEGDPT